MKHRTSNSSGNITIGSITNLNDRKCVVGKIKEHTAVLYDYKTMIEVAEIPTKELDIE